MADEKTDKECFDVDEFINQIKEEERAKIENGDSNEEDGSKERGRLLKEALGDLEKELIELKDEKKMVEETLEKIKKNEKKTHDEELELRKKIERLVEEEVNLSAKKDSLQKGLTKIQERISKVDNIKNELEDI